MRSAEVSSPLEFDRCGAEADAHTSAERDCKQICHRRDKERLGRGKLKAKFRKRKCFFHHMTAVGSFSL